MTKASFTPHLNHDVLDTASPPIPEARAWADAYDGRAGPLINLSQAVPGLAPPSLLLDALGKHAASAKAATYGAITGDLALREAYADDIALSYGKRPDAAEIAITSGCNQAFVVTMMTLARAGDTVILPSPWYFNHQMTLQMLSIKACPLPCHAENGFVPRIEDAEALIDTSTRAIVLVTPNNPTGAVYSPHIIADFAALARRHNIHLVIDETYRDFLPESVNRPHGLFAKTGWQDHVIQLYSFSKAYAMPGWRLGAVMAGHPVITQIAKWLDCIQISPVRAGQMALAETLPQLMGWRDDNRRAVNQRGALFQHVMSKAPEWTIGSCGAYFAFVQHPFKGVEAAHVGEMLAKQRGVLTLPGSCFGPGQSRNLRIAIANVADNALETLPERLEGFAL